MQVWNDVEVYADGPAKRGPVVATIGNYDGVHLGHQRIIDSVLRDARARSLPSLLLTFDPHPLAVVGPAAPPRLLMTRRQKLEALEAQGLDGVLVLKFDERLARLGGEEFIERFLQPRVRCATLHVGRNFRFGRDRGGDLALLETLGRRGEFEVVGIPPVEVDGETVSSSAIRDAVAQGDVERAWRLIGRPFELTGEVVASAGRGRTLGFPTANLDAENELLPRGGVYVTEAGVLASRYASITNVGVRPTFDGQALVVETHLLDFEGDLYGERMSLRLLARLRDEQRFADPGALADQIARDRAAAESFFENAQIRSR